MTNPFVAWIQSFLARRRFPQLLAITAVLFVADVLIPDLIPFVDELLLGLVTLLLASLKKSVTERGRERKTRAD